MKRIAIFAAATLVLGACAPDTSLPTRPYQWQQRQERIEREYNARLALCETLDQDSERYASDCRRPGDED